VNNNKPKLINKALPNLKEEEASLVTDLSFAANSVQLLANKNSSALCVLFSSSSLLNLDGISPILEKRDLNLFSIASNSLRVLSKH